MKTNDELEPQLARLLDRLREQPERNAQAAAHGRAAFLAEAQEMATAMPEAVTAAGNQRHNGWMHALRSIFSLQRKEQSPMFGTLSTILLIVSLILGGSGVTIAAAQQSLPDDALYPVKTWSEEVRVRLSENNDQSRLQLVLELANRRAEETQQMLQTGQVPPETIQSRWQTELDQALRLAVEKPNPEAVHALEQIREQLQMQEQALLQVSPSPANPQAIAALDRARTMLQDRLRLCVDGIQDPSVLREQLRNRDRKQDGLPPATPGPASTQSGTIQPRLTGTASMDGGKGHGFGDRGTATVEGKSNPWVTGTPTPGSGYGPGPGTGSQDPTGEGNPRTEGTPARGGGDGGQDGGNGSNTGETPGGPGPGPQPEQPGGGSGSESGNMGGNGPDSGADSGGGTGGGSGGGEGGRGGH